MDKILYITNYKGTVDAWITAWDSDCNSERRWYDSITPASAERINQLTYSNAYQARIVGMGNTTVTIAISKRKGCQ